MIFLAGVAVGFAGVPLQNRERIATIESRMDAKFESLEQQVIDLKIQVREFTWEWRRHEREKSREN